MADAGDLQKLPLEIRKEIYKHLLVETKKIDIIRQNCRGGVKVARMDNHQDSKHRGKVWDSRQRRWVDALPSAASILLVNKQISHEARQVLYGSNDFEFDNALALETFLKHTGDAINHLRHIALTGTGALYRGSWASMDRCLVRLAKAKALRTLEFSHLALCHHHKAVHMKSLVEHCKPLLEALQVVFTHKKLKVQVFDVVKIALPPCSHHEFHDDTSGPYDWGSTRRGFRMAHRVKRGGSAETKFCLCRCEEAEQKNKRFTEELRREITGQLGLDVDEM